MKTEKVPALQWQLDIQDPEVQLKDRGKVERWYYPLIQLKGEGRAVSFATGEISIKQNINTEAVSQSFNLAEVSVKQNINAEGLVFSEAIRGEYYLPTIQNLKGTALATSFAVGTESDITSFVQLQSGTKSKSYAGNPAIYYINYASSFVSQSFFSESSQALTLNTFSTTKSRAFGNANAQAYAKLIAATSKVICSSKSLVEITRAFNLYTDVITKAYSDVIESISRPLNAISYTETNNQASKSILQKLTTDVLDQATSYGTTRTKVDLKSKVYSTSFMEGAEVLNRLLAAKSLASSKTDITLSKKINTTSETLDRSRSESGEIVSRLLNGVADSISISQKSLGSVQRLFVSGAIAKSFSSTSLHITTHLHSAFYSQSFINGGDIFVSRPLASKANTGNPFHGEISKKLTTQSEAAAITISNGNEVVNRQLASTANSRNPFKSNPNLRKEIESGAYSRSRSNAQGFNSKLNLAATSKANTELIGSEVVDRFLASGILSDSNSEASISVLHNTYGTTVSQTKLSGNELINKELSSENIDTTKFNSDISIHRPTSSEVIEETKSAAENPLIKINLVSEAIVISDSDTNLIINRGLNSQSKNLSYADAEALEILINIYGSAIGQSFANSELMEKQLNLVSEVLVQTYIGGTDTYFGNLQKEVGFVQTTEQSVINLAPFNYGADNTLN